MIYSPKKEAPMPTAGGIKAGKAFVVIEALDRTGVVLKGVRKNLTNLANDIGNIGKKTIGAALMGLAPAFISSKVFMDFDDAMKKVEARSKGTAEEMDALREQAKKLGRETAFTAGQIGELQMRIAQKGFDRRQILDMTEAIMNLARAGGEGFDLAEDANYAAEIVTGTLRAYQMEAKEAADVADLFTATVNNSNYTLSDLATSMQYVGPIARKMGMSLEQTLAALGMMTNVNIDPSIAGTALRNIMQYMSNAKGRDDFNAILKEATGNTIEFIDASGNLKSVPDVLFAMSKAMAGMGSAESMDALNKLLGVRASVPATALMDGMEEYAKLLSVLERKNGKYAESVSKIIESGIGGAWREFMSALEGVALAIGEGLAPALIDSAKHINNLLTTVSKWIHENDKVIITVTLVTMAVLAAGVGMVGFSLILKVLIPVILMLGVGIKGLSFMLGLLNVTIVKNIMIWTLSRVVMIAYGLYLVTLSALILALNVSLIILKGALFGLLAILTALPAIVTGVTIAIRLLSMTLLFGKLAADAVIAGMFILINVLAGVGFAIAATITLMRGMSIASVLLSASLILAAARTVAVRLAMTALAVTLAATKLTIKGVIAAGYALGMLMTSWRGITLAWAGTVALAQLTLALFTRGIWASIAVVGMLQNLMAMSTGAIAFLMSPLGALTVALIALGAILFLNRDTIFKWLGDQLGETSSLLQGIGTDINSWFMQMVQSGKALGTTLISTFGGVTTALTLGDTAAAWEIGLAGMELAWSQLVDMMYDTWEGFSNFFVEVWEGAMTSFLNGWTKTQTSISKGLLELSASSAWTDVFGAGKAQKEAEDAEKRRLESIRKLEEQGISMAGTNGSVNNTEDVSAAGLQGQLGRLDRENKAASEARNKASGDRLRNRKKKQEEEDIARQEDINKKKEELDKKLKDINARAEEEKKKAEAAAGGDIDELVAGFNERAAAMIKNTGTAYDGPLKAESGLEKGTSEAFKQAYENAMREGQGLDPDAEERKKVVDRLDTLIKENREFRESLTVA
jgi:TP901 family phage tail tape measure protein